MLGLGGAAILIEEAPEIEFRAGLFYIVDTLGDGTIVRVMRPNVFFRLFARAGEAAREHKFSGAEVVAFPRAGETPAHG
jgi:hypothetical protein